MIITLLQFSPAFDDRKTSRGLVAALLGGVESDWIVLPEMCLSGFTMNVEAATWNEDDFSFFSTLAREKGAFVTAGGVRGRRNCAFTFGSDGKLLSLYEKRHLFSPSAENRHYEAGGSAEVVALTFGRAGSEEVTLRVAPSICYDLRFPYHFWKLARTADAYFSIAAWPRSRREHWKTLLAARAVENQAFVIGVNRTGSSPDTNYSGDSTIVDPKGRLLLECGSEEGAFSADIDPGAASTWRKNFGAMNDRLE